MIMASVIEDGPPVIAIRTSGSKQGTYRDVIDRIAEIEKMGSWIARSKMFGCDNEAQGCTIAIECILTGVTPIEYAKRNKIVANKPFMQYDSMLATFRERGGESKIVQATPEVVEIWLKNDKKEVTATLTWQDLQKEPVPYNCSEKDYMEMIADGKTPPLKAKYATPISRRTMMLARLISSTMRAEFPEVCYGQYTPEEIEDIVDAEVIASEPAREEVKRRAIEAKTEPLHIDLGKTRHEHLPAKEEAQPEPAKEPARTPITAPVVEGQLVRIKQLMAEVHDAGMTDIKDRITTKLKASGLNRLADLTIAEADVLIASLTERNATIWANASLAGHGRSPE
jgi:hypothetical protein